MKRLCSMMMLIAAMTFLMTACGGDDDAPTPPREVTPPDSPGGSDASSPSSFQLLRSCYTCKGDKKCVNCNGTGKGCMRCGGSGRYCSYCEGKGYDTSCNGTGDCKFCYGTGVEYCGHCRTFPGHCSACRGIGWIGNDSRNTCSLCKGTTKCSYCHGNYEQTCSYCKGTRNCKYCNGSGQCPTCNGNPTCTSCGGDGHCLSCNASGMCTECAGTGETRLIIIDFKDPGGDQTVYIRSTSEWSISTDVEWIRFSRTSGSGDYTLTVTAEKNTSTEWRRGTVTFTYGTSKQDVTVSQDGEAVRFDVAPSSIFVWCWGTGEGDIKVSSNTSWTVKAADSWVTCSPSSGTGDATITVSATPYYDGTRYTTLTISDTSGEYTKDINIAQATDPDNLNMLKNLIEKPFGTIDVDLYTASYQQVRDAVAKVYKFASESSKYKSFQISYVENPGLTDITYMGLSLCNFSFIDNDSFNSADYSFRVYKAQAPNGYKSYLNNILQDFKFNLGATLKDEGSNKYYIELWGGRDAKNCLCGVRVEEYSDCYYFLIYYSYGEK